MSVLRNLLSVRLVLESAPECWDGKLRSAALLGAVVFGVFYFAALLQINDPLDMFRPEAVSWRAWVSWAAICLPATIFLSSWLLVVLRRAVGYIVFSVSMIYLGPMMTAVAISLVARSGPAAAQHGAGAPRRPLGRLLPIADVEPHAANTVDETRKWTSAWAIDQLSIGDEGRSSLRGG
ncbi:hypothetical protein BV379_15645 [Rhodovulum sulfidophilum]|nr:hypothetical protein BV379_15645 [Rhodovulum sulfidophilum]